MPSHMARGLIEVDGITLVHWGDIDKWLPKHATRLESHRIELAVDDLLR